METLRTYAAPYDLGDPTNEQEIQKTERELGVQLPESYKWFVREFNGAAWPEEIAGVGGSFMDLVGLTIQERYEVEQPMPLHLIPFCPNGIGNYYVMDTSQMMDGECPVVFWNHEASEEQIPERTYATFLDWLEQALERGIAYLNEE